MGQREQQLAARTGAQTMSTKIVDPPTQPPLTGISPGGTGTFTLSPFDQNGNPIQQPSGQVPQWSVDDSTLTVTPSTDGLTCSITVPAGDTSPSFNITVTCPTLPNNPSGKANCPIVVLQVAGYTINQTS
jgi:hypothetical protein